MSYAALIREMMDAGANPQVILIAVEAMEARDKAEAERKERAGRASGHSVTGNGTVA